MCLKMISKKMEPLVANSSVVRAMFEEGKRMADEYGAENVFDFSVGNPIFSISPCTSSLAAIYFMYSHASSL